MEVEMSPEEERERIRVLLEKMGRHVAMVAFVLPEPATPHDVTNSGTVSFLSLPKGKFIITNHHVWDTYSHERNNTPGLRFAVMGNGFGRPLDLSSAELVDSDAGSDLAVLRFEHSEQIEEIGKAFYQPKRWPLDQGQVGDDVAFVGFPGMRRHATDEALRFESVLLNHKVLAVSDRKLRLSFENPEPLIHSFSSKPIAEFRWGGMSGSMVYRLDLSLNQFFVTGFFNAAGDGLHVSYYASRADLLLENGMITH